MGGILLWKDDQKGIESAIDEGGNIMGRKETHWQNGRNVRGG